MEYLPVGSTPLCGNNFWFYVHSKTIAVYFKMDNKTYSFEVPIKHLHEVDVEGLKNKLNISSCEL
jgi:hypothetical protein